MKTSNRLSLVVLSIMLVSLAATANAQCWKNRCPSRGYTRSTYYRPVQTVQEPEPEPCDPEEEPIPDEEQLAEFKAVECEVQVQHPLTFDWKTVKEFPTEEEAFAYQEQISKRYWVIYQPRGANSSAYLEANDKQDAQSKVSALRQNGNRVQQLTPVELQVVEKSIAPIFAEEDESDLLVPVDNPESEDRVETVLASLATPETPKIPSELAPLVGIWKATTEQANGEVASILLELRNDGSATLTVPDAKGGTASLTREVSLTDGNLLLSNGSKTLSLGKVESAEANQVVIARAEGQFTFLRQ